PHCRREILSRRGKSGRFLDVRIVEGKRLNGRRRHKFYSRRRQTRQRARQCGIIRTLAERPAYDEHVELIGHFIPLVVDVRYFASRPAVFATSSNVLMSDLMTLVNSAGDDRLATAPMPSSRCLTASLDNTCCIAL